MNIQTRQPTGKPPWPIVLLAGAEKAGKSYAAAAASSSDLVGRTFWIGVGEDDPDEYGAIDGARFEIVTHDGTYQGILAAVRAATAQPAEGVPNMVVIDSATRLWEMLSDEAQILANRRRKNNNPDQDSPISMDLWNRAADRWHTVMDAVRAHNGPTLITARLDVVTVLDENGKPTKEKTSKIKSQKTLPFDVGVIVEMPARGETYITGARSLKFDVPVGVRKPIKDFTVHGLLTQLGLAEAGATAPRQHSGVDAAGSANEGRQQPAPAAKTEDAGATALHARQQAATTHPAPATPNWNQLFAAACGNRAKLEALRHQGKNMGLPETYGMFAAIEAELKAITDAEQADNVMEGTLV
jgi:hypothetical protein